MKKTPGRKPTGDKALTPAQKMQRQRIKNKFKTQIAKEHGYVATTVLMSSKQLESIAKFVSLRNLEETSLDSTIINDVVFKGLKLLLNYYEIDSKEHGHSQELIDQCSYSDENDYINYLLIELETEKLFKQWELSQLNQPKES